MSITSPCRPMFLNAYERKLEARIKSLQTQIKQLKRKERKAEKLTHQEHKTNAYQAIHRRHHTHGCGGYSDSSGNEYLIMTPSQQAKVYGCESLVWLSAQSDVKVRTLFDWFHDHPKRVECICRGAVDMKEGSNEQNK